MYRQKRIPALLICLAFGITGRAQPNDIGNWFMHFGTQGFAKRFVFHNEVQYRNYDFVGDIEQLMLRTGLGINLSENNNNLLLGYAFIPTAVYAANTTDKLYSQEHRIFQQFITRQRYGRIYLQHRYRFEQRFLTNSFRSRIRYFISINVVINRAEMQKGALYFSAYNELFIHGNSPLFDRNRLYGAMGYAFGPNLRLELGAMTQIFEYRHRTQTQIALFNNLPFTAKRKKADNH
jgi:hypothetical protein